MALTAKEQLDLDTVFRKLASMVGYTDGTFIDSIGAVINGAAADSLAAHLAGAETFTGNKIFSGVVGYGAAQALTGAGAVNVTARNTRITASGIGDAVTLADGTLVGQRKSITGVAGYTSSHTSVITPSHFADGTNITLSAKFDGVELSWNGTSWEVVGLYGTASIA